jgi:hypothetical protein
MLIFSILLNQYLGATSVHDFPLYIKMDPVKLKSEYTGIYIVHVGAVNT